MRKLVKFIIFKINNQFKKIEKFLNFLLGNEKRALVITGIGERYDPKLTKWEDFNHLKRYEFANKFIHGSDIVIDIACGTGYGTKQLGITAKFVYGVDISKIAIKYARRKYKQKNTSYILNNFWEFKTKGDVVVSFETIEHIPNDNGISEAIKKLIDLTKRILIVSVPYNEKEGNNPHHVHFNLNEKSFFNLDEYNLKFYFQKSDGIISSEKIENTFYQNLLVVISK